MYLGLYALFVEMEDQYVLASPDLGSYSFGPTDYYSALQCCRRSNCPESHVLVKCEPVVIGVSLRVVLGEDFCWLPQRERRGSHIKWLGFRLDFQKVIHQSIEKGEVVAIPSDSEIFALTEEADE